MKESKVKSFEWLRNRDASEIIEIDIEGELSQPSELLVENTTSFQDSDIKIQLDQIYSKVPKNLPKLLKTKEAASYDSIDSIPLWGKLCNELSIVSKDSFDWLKSIDCDAETSGILEASQGIVSNLPSRSIYSAILYWGCENLNENDWMPAVRSIYFMFTNKKADWFYVIFRRFYCMFCRENNKPVVYISNPTTQLIANLKKALVNIPQEENENLIKVKNKKIPLLKIEGKSIQAFYNYLANNSNDNKIIAPCVFLNAQFKSLNPICNCEIFNSFETCQKQYKLAFAGVISCDMIIKLCKVLNQTQTSFCIELINDHNSDQFPGTMPTKICKTAENVYDIIN